jgi:orotidine-5'-phosphate decarboxylase
VTESAGFVARLYAAASRNQSLVCVGLDPELEKIPAHIRSLPQALFEFNRRIIDATAEYACCFKPQFAHYAAVGAEDQLLATIRYIHERHPGLPVILDSKRGDIGSTAAKYAQESFERYGADGKRLYRHVAERVARDWNVNGQCMLVIGATYPEELAEIRAVAGAVPFLVPGVGAQGGDVAAAVRAGRTADGLGLVLNSSRGIIYAGNAEDFADAAREAARKLRDEINLYR